MDQHSLNMRSHLSRVRGLGANHQGVQHFWAQRLSAVAVLPLIVWFLIVAIDLASADYKTFVNWVGHGYNPVLLTLLIVFGFYHGQLGLQVIIEDYVKSEAHKIPALIFVKIITTVIILCSIFSVMRLTFGN